MKRFILKSIVFVVLGIIILNIWGYILINSSEFSEQFSWYKIQRQVKKSHESISSKVLFLGDSVGGQLFPRGKPNSLVVNGSILTVGHYILAHNSIKKNKHLRYIILASVPNVIGQPFERERTYHNFMKPFYTFENLKLISKSLNSKINKNKLGPLVLLPFVKTAPCFSDIDYSGTGKKNPRWMLSDIAIEYLKKLDCLCRENKIKFNVVSPPIHNRWRQRTNSWQKMRSQIKTNGLEHIFKGYFKNMIYLNQTYFSKNIHLKPKYLREFRKKIIKKLLPPEIFPFI